MDALTVPALLTAAARAYGDRSYVVSPTERLTYADADRRSAHLARWLLGQGAGKGTRIGLFMPNSAQWVSWWLAVSRIGAVAVPLSTMYRPLELAKVLRLADVAMLIAPPQVLDIDVVGRLREALPGLDEQHDPRITLREAPFLRRIVFTEGGDQPWVTTVDDADAVPQAIQQAAEAEVHPADLAIMVHTSGSTADPKGVMHTHGTLVRQTSTWPAAIRAVTGSDADPVILSAMPFFWIGGVLAATGALHEPVTLLVLPKLDPATALDLAEKERATGLVGWPAFTQRLREHPSFADRDLSSAPMLRDGPLDIAMTDVPDGFPVHRTMSETAGGFAHTDIAIVDDAGVPVPDGQVGELLVRGIGVMAGYNKRERSDTFDPDGWYHTGDRVYRRTGDPRLFYVGRTSELIKTSGANVSPLEVEAVIEGFDDVAQCVVVGAEHPERDEEVCAVLVPAGGGIDIESVARRTRDALSSYKVPTRWLVTGSDRIPTLPSGKLNRREIRSWFVNSGAAEAL
ncbi:class I adenylate-forming enzyme family protein [Mycolicibacterium vaccae]|uniref:AMP-dependent synthetase and ligase n=1 Tax=Mycolicibacterium vaccae ATCC 25954 TaxID=1194972 RepID=K0USJ4_MYCVA|nr:class I adenylate-forming enzyme family protein [Mycolicibacterium vaccae]ANI40266.1 AMP-dependent synthetase [Mycolicibacterium vaccae 95051]EJZ10102.1 AMP-dependent synthetase and ligase [Mycolicibacterium vaccae ATCC 25954]MCV7059980.1 acyl--CoA ligase [Mycolicibacterium vaccae]